MKRIFFARKSSFVEEFIHRKKRGDAIRINSLREQPPTFPAESQVLPGEAPFSPAPPPAVHLIDRIKQSECHHIAAFLSSLISKAKVLETNFNQPMGEFMVELDRPYTLYLANLTDGLAGKNTAPDASCNQIILNKVLKGKIEKSGDKEILTFSPESGWIPLFFGKRANLVPISYTREGDQIHVALKIPIFGDIRTSLANFKGILNHSYMYPEHPENSRFNAKQLVPYYKLQA